MAKKNKQIVWHKRQQKFISPTLLKPHHDIQKDKDPPAAGTAGAERKKVFVQDLLKKIRSAVRE